MSSEQETISADYAFQLQRIQVADNAVMAYIDTDPKPTPDTNKPLLVFLHGNPMYSYLWRNIIPHVEPRARCIAPDLMGMGASQKLSSEAYGWHNHVRYLDSFLEKILGSEKKVILVLHDFGSLLGFNWAHHHSERLAGLVFMEFLYDFPDWHATNTEPEFAKKLGTSPDTLHKAIVDENVFIEEFIQDQVVRKLSSEELDYYRAPFLKAEDRQSMVDFAMMMPVKGANPDSSGAAEKDQAWLAETDLPKLYFWADPGKMQPPKLAKETSEKLKNITSISVGHAKHYLQEDHPHLVGREIAKWLGSAELNKA